MNDKTKLIESMANLIQHVSTSRKHQQQIFATLSIADLKKILSNLQDSNEKLRKITLTLLSQLLYENSTLQKRFCQLTGTPQYPGKIALSSRFPKAILYDAQALTEVIKILKDNSNLKQRGLFWYIDPQSKPKILQIVKKNSLISIDPLNYIVGVWIIDESKEDPRNSNLMKPYFQMQIKNDNKNRSNMKVRLNRSHYVQKNNTSQFKPQTPMTPMKVSMTQQTSANQNLLHRQNNYVEQSVTPIQIKSQIKNTSKFDNPRIVSTTQRKSYYPTSTISTFDTLKYIKPSIYTSGAPMTTTHQQYNQSMKIQSPGPGNLTTRGAVQFKSYVYPRSQFRKN